MWLEKLAFINYIMQTDYTPQSKDQTTKINVEFFEEINKIGQTVTELISYFLGDSLAKISYL